MSHLNFKYSIIIAATCLFHCISYSEKIDQLSKIVNALEDGFYSLAESECLKVINNSNNDDRKNLSFLCTRISPELEGIVLPELSSSKNTNIEAEEEVVTSCDWLSNSKANVGLSSGKIILAH